MKFIPLCSGSSGNATYIEAGDARLLIDAGLSCKRICELLKSVGAEPSLLTAILVTHEHSDHIKGIEVLAKKFGIPVYANRDCWSRLRVSCPGIPARQICVFESDRDFFLGKVRVFPFTTPHDAVHSVGYTVSCAGRTAAVCTDLGRVDKRILSVLAGADIVLIESNHDVDMLMAGPYPYDLKQRILSGHGHLCNEDCGRALVELYKTGVRNAVLGHLSKENNMPDIAVATVKSVLSEAGIGDFRLALAGRDAPNGIYEL